jgi:hypothetical protein
MAGIDDLNLGTGSPNGGARPPRDSPADTQMHDPAYLEGPAVFCRAGDGSLDPNSLAKADPWSVTWSAAGAALAAVDALRQGISDVMRSPVCW